MFDPHNRLNFDYVIIGAGAAGLKLAMAMKREPFFRGRKIAILDYSLKSNNDKTYSYWEYGSGIWDSIVAKQWNAVQVFDKGGTSHVRNLNGLIYKQINSIDFYKHCLSELDNDERFTFINERVLFVGELDEYCVIDTSSRRIHCGRVFDSRVEAEFRENEQDHLYIKQTFEGWFIKTKNPVFNTEAFTFMDFRLQYEDSTSFTYILPQLPNLALLEFTLFANYTLPKWVFEEKLVEYMDKFYPGEQYEVVEKERNIHPIPMTTYRFDKEFSQKILKIGVAGGWTKPSSGFTFSRGEKYIKKIIDQLKEGKKLSPGYKMVSTRFLFYDKLLLRVLKYQEQEGTRILRKMLESSKIESVFRFLDEETTLAEELGLMLELPKWPFIKALFHKN